MYHSDLRRDIRVDWGYTGADHLGLSNVEIADLWNRISSDFDQVAVLPKLKETGFTT